MTGLSMWVVYDHPRDYPNSFIARRWIADANRITATEDIAKAATIEALQLHFRKQGLVKINRSPTDDPKIVETWL